MCLASHPHVSLAAKVASSTTGVPAGVICFAGTEAGGTEIGILAGGIAIHCYGRHGGRLLRAKHVPATRAVSAGARTLHNPRRTIIA